MSHGVNFEPELQLHKFISADDHEELLKKALLSGEYDINDTDSHGFSSLHWAGLVLICSSARCCDVTVKENSRKTSDHMTFLFFFRKENVVELLTQLNADPTIRDSVHGLTPLDYAIGQYANPQIARIIVGSYATDKIFEILRSTDEKLNTPLHIAAKFGVYPCLLLLIQRGALASVQNKDGKLPIDLCPEGVDHRILAQLERAAMKEDLSRCWQCAKLSHHGTKRCSRCHYARYCDRNCQVLHWKTHQKNCEPVVLAKSDGHIVSQMFENSEKRIEDHLDEVIYCEALMKNGNIKDISVGTIGDINQSSKELYRELSDGKHGLTKAEFTVEVQIPHNMERGPLLVTDVKRRIIAFVSPKERGYDLLCNKIEKHCARGKQFAFFTSEFDSAFPGTLKVFASTCASSYR
ncbi:Oidioi.mRNA.OKI2018_I69.PAR.g11643.t1.cds [Oikopleura dioica]|uniref:Oidioi.mRNA.OKI2018_I69.PAR.g11643.t1.cds n=1 Tax=Oikopleura dioica TaxID=34765 RepID=A0ABN7RX27_OIKDI|nr:Oidioi.mRNA.OKI2018_I69.PAR.g11643.t1.cds [Oikopleura dioica]